MKKILTAAAAAFLAAALLAGCTVTVNSSGSSSSSKQSSDSSDSPASSSDGSQSSSGEESSEASESSESSVSEASSNSGQPSGDLTLGSLRKAAEAAGYTVSDSFGYAQEDGIPKADAGFSFKHPELFMSVCVLEFASESDAKAYLDFRQGNTANNGRVHMRDRYILEIPVSNLDDGFTDEMEADLVKGVLDDSGWLV